MAESDRLFETFMSLRGRLARLVRGIVPPKEVEDIVQETYVRVCQVENRAAIREPRSFLFRTAQNLALDHVKRSESRLTVGVDSIDNVSFADIGPPSDATYDQVATTHCWRPRSAAITRLPNSVSSFVLSDDQANPDDLWMYDEREESAEATRRPVAACPAVDADEFIDNRLRAPAG